MWQKVMVAATIVVALFASTALASASQSTPGAQTNPADIQADHWSEMIGQWPEMVGHMQGVMDDGSPDIVKRMRMSVADMDAHMNRFDRTAPDMGRLDMGGTPLAGPLGAMHS